MSGGFLGGGIGPRALGGGAAAASDWWTVSDQTCVAAYQPIGAASLAASYINLANPGTYNAAPGVAPTLGAGGWRFDGSTQRLRTGIAPNNNNWSAIIRFSDWTSNSGQKVLFGESNNGGTGTFSIYWYLYNTTARYANGGNVNYARGSATAGIAAIAGAAAYFDSADVGAIPTAIITHGEIWIGWRYADYGAFICQAFAIYSTTLSAADVATLTARMVAL